MRSRLASALLLAIVTLLLVTGCGYQGLGSLPLPYRTGTGSDAVRVTVQLPSVANLAPNSEVKVADVTVGTVTGISFEDWHARLDVSLLPSVHLPANATARVGQKSLLGAEYLEMAPPTTEPAVGVLQAGDVVPLSHTGRFPETEELLAALSVVLNGGGLNQIATITTELNRALDGRQGDIRALVGNLDRFVAGLDAQKGDIIRAIDGLNRLSGTLAAQRPVIENALDTIPGGLKVLSNDRDEILAALKTLGDAGDQLRTVVNQSGDDLIANLHNLRPTLGNLASAGKNLTESTSLLVTFPFPARTDYPSVIKGDYANLYATIDVSPDLIVSSLFGGFTLPRAGLLSTSSLGAGVGAPLLGPSGVARGPGPNSLLPNLTPGQPNGGR
jgi:phospholipid/cholesterol/gamma-HCH transport system substrate-binding protein